MSGASIAIGPRVIELMQLAAGIRPTMEGLRRHVLSAALPDMTEDEFIALRDSIESEGLRFPIKLLDGQVLDGWHRLRACLDLMLTPTFEDFPDDEDPRRYVEAANLARRSLSPSQRALAKAAIYAYTWAPKGANQHAPAGSAIVADVGEKTTAQMAAEAGVSERMIGSAKVVVKDGAAEVKDAVKRGDLPVHEAEKIARLPKEQQPEAVKDKLKEKATPKQRKPRELKPEADERAARAGTPAAVEPGSTSVREQAGEDAHGDTDLVDELERSVKRNEELEAQIAAMSADDGKAEIAKWQRLAHVAQQRQGELMDSAAKAQDRQKWTMNQLRRCGKAVGEDDPSKIAATVEAMARKAMVPA